MNITARFRILLLVILTAVSCQNFIGCGEEKSDKTITICSFGGGYQESQREAFFKPASKQIGIVVKEALYNGEYDKIRTMVNSGKVIWDVVDFETSMVIRGAKEGLLEPIDYNMIDKEQFIPEAIHPHGIGSVVWSTVIAYNTEKYPSGTPHPTTWAEFWDVEEFPGPRSLRNSPKGNLEFALLADGVCKEELYPIDIDRAFEVLDRIRPHIKVWWQEGEQPRHLLSSGKVVLASAYNGRIWTGIKNNEHIAIEWGEGVMDMSWWVIPKGAKKDLAMEFIAFATALGQQALQTKYIAYGPTNKEAVKLANPLTVAHLPTEPSNMAKQFSINNEWWGEHEAEVMKRWVAWLSE